AAGQEKPQEAPAFSVPSLLEAVPLSPADRGTLEDAVRGREYARAEKLLLAQVDQNPKSTSLLTLLGSIFFLDGQYLNCAVAMKKAEAIAPIDETSRFALSMAYVALDHGDWARPELERLAESYPRNHLYPYWLARLDYNDMQFTAAIAHLQKAIRQDAN